MKEIVKHFRSALSFYRHCDADGKRRPTCITQKELAAKTGVAQSSVSRALRVNAGQVETLIGLAEACDVPTAVFLRTVADLMEDRPSMVKNWKAGVRYNDNSRPRCHDCGARLLRKSPGVTRRRFSTWAQRVVDAQVCAACADPVSP